MAVQRVNDSLLGPLERTGLKWLAVRLPAWTTPNHLTVLGFCGAVLTGAGYVLSHWWLPGLLVASLGLFLNWFGDSLDGTLARLRRIERPRFGFFVDHTCDVFSQIIVFIGLGVSPCAHFGVACLGLIAFLMAFVYSLIGVQVHGELHITYFGFGPSEIRALLFVGNILAVVFGVIDLGIVFPPLERVGFVSVFDVVISVVSVSAVILIAVLAVRRGAALAIEDPPRKMPPVIPVTLKADP